MVRCATLDCSWRVHASKEENADTSWVMTMLAMHICGRGIVKTVHLKASKHAWMGKEVARATIHGGEVSSYDLLL